MPPVACDPTPLPYAYIVAVWGAAIFAAAVGWLANYQVQSWLYRRVQRIDRLRQALYDYLGLASDYWYGALDPEQRGVTESRLIVSQQVISLEYSLLAAKHRKVRASFKKSQNARLRLWDSVTGDASKARIGLPALSEPVRLPGRRWRLYGLWKSDLGRHRPHLLAGASPPPIPGIAVVPRSTETPARRRGACHSRCVGRSPSRDDAPSGG